MTRNSYKQEEAELGLKVRIIDTKSMLKFLTSKEVDHMIRTNGSWSTCH